MMINRFNVDIQHRPHVCRNSWFCVVITGCSVFEYNVRKLVFVLLFRNEDQVVSDP